MHKTPCTQYIVGLLMGVDVKVLSTFGCNQNQSMLKPFNEKLKTLFASPVPPNKVLKMILPELLTYMKKYTSTALYLYIIHSLPQENWPVFEEKDIQIDAISLNVFNELKCLNLVHE
jgi:hypothetical protein